VRGDPGLLQLGAVGHAISGVKCLAFYDEILGFVMVAPGEAQCQRMERRCMRPVQKSKRSLSAGHCRVAPTMVGEMGVNSKSLRIPLGARWVDDPHRSRNDAFRHARAQLARPIHTPAISRARWSDTTGMIRAHG
jgi:hypothetical protein